MYPPEAELQWKSSTEANNDGARVHMVYLTLFLRFANDACASESDRGYHK